MEKIDLLQKLKEFLKSPEENEFNPDVLKYLSIKITYYFTNTIKTSFSLFGRLPRSLETDLMEFEDKVMDFFHQNYTANPDYKDVKEFIDDCYNVKVGIGKNIKFEDLTLGIINGNNKLFKHEKGTVLLVDFWATWCQFCQEPMHENIHLFKKYHSELQKDPNSFCKDLRFLAISCDEKQDILSQWIEKNNFNIKEENGTNSKLVEHYVKKTVRADLGIKSIPCICVVDKEGVIKYYGTPLKFNLEKGLEELCTKGKIEEYKNSDINTENASDKLKEFNSYLEKNNLGKVGAYLTVEATYNLENETESELFASLYLKGKVQQFEIDEIKQKISDIKTLFGGIEIVNRLEVEQLKLDDDF